MLIGATGKSVDDIASLKSLGFDFGEVLISTPRSRRYWWEAGITSNQDKFFLIAHGPLEDPSDDIRYLRDHYLPTLKATIETAARIGIALLTIHLTLDSSMNHSLLIEKKRALKELVDYGRRSNVAISLENVSESVEDLEAVLDAVPGLAVTVDVGHAHLVSPRTPFEIIRRVGSSIRHVHLHDNHGDEDIHLSIGEGRIDFPGILRELVNSGYDATLTLELLAQYLMSSRKRVKALLEEATR
jgi:sugar phosphate isomerase/epimerase